MKIYAYKERYSNPFTPFVGSDIWVRVSYHILDTQFYVQILDMDEELNTCHYHRALAYDVDCKNADLYSSQALSLVFDYARSEDLSHLRLMCPIDARTTDEIRDALTE